mgnify:CR=1 FL=1
MMVRYITTLTALLITLAAPARDAGNCNIGLELKGNGSSFVSLAYHLGDKQYIQDTIYTDEQGMASYRSEEPLKQGLYMIVFPDNNMFELIMSGDQVFSIYCDRDDIINSLRFTGSEENTVFTEYRKKWMAFQKEAAEYRGLINNMSNADSARILQLRLKNAEEDILEYIESTAAAHEGSLLSSMLYSMLPLQVPEFDVTGISGNRDSLRWAMGYNYSKEHFFDNTDLADPRLMRTPIIHNKLKTYFSSVLIQAPDSVISGIRLVASEAEADPETFRYVIAYIFNHFRDSRVMGHDAIIVMLADEYYLNGKAGWADEQFLENLRKDVAALRPNLIGTKAADLTMQTFAGMHRSVHDISAEFTVLYFWEPNCGHCSEATPLLRDFYTASRDRGVEIFAVCTQSNKEEWEEYITEHELEWINGWDPVRTTRYDYYYNVKATPLIYVLNSDKEIIAKNIPADRLAEFIDNYRRLKGSGN